MYLVSLSTAVVLLVAMISVKFPAAWVRLFEGRLVAIPLVTGGVVLSVYLAELARSGLKGD